MTTKVAVIMKSAEISEDKTKNLEKKPTSGGIPAIENKTIESVTANIIFFVPLAVQLIK